MSLISQTNVNFYLKYQYNDVIANTIDISLVQKPPPFQTKYIKISN